MAAVKTSRKNIKTAYKRKEALGLRLQGKSYELISQKIGYCGRSSAYKAVKAAIRDITQEPAEEVKKIELERLNLLQSKLFEELEKDPTNLPVYDRILKVQDMRSKYLGLYSAEKVEATLDVNVIRLPEKKKIGDPVEIEDARVIESEMVDIKSLPDPDDGDKI